MATNSSISSPETRYEIVAELLPISLVIVIVNSLVFFLFVKEKRLQTPTNYLLLSLAVCDFINGAINIPLFMVVLLGVIAPPAGAQFGFFVVVLNNMVIILMVYHIFAVTVERYFSIVRPFQHRRMTKKMTLKVVAAIWLTAAVIAFMPFAWFWRSSSPEFDPLAKKLQFGHIIFCLAFVFLVPYIFMIYSQIVTFGIIRKGISKSRMSQKGDSAAHRKGLSKPCVSQNGESAVHRKGMSKSRISQKGEFAVHRKVKNDKRCLIVFAAMALIGFVCWLPWFIISLFYSVWFPLSEETLKTLKEVSHAFLIIRYLTSIVNPVLYTFFKNDFLVAFKINILRQKHRRLSQGTTSTGTLLYNRGAPNGPGTETTRMDNDVDPLLTNGGANGHHGKNTRMEENVDYLTSV